MDNLLLWRLLLKGKGVIDNTRTLAYYVQDSENRTMQRPIPLESHIPFYVDKYLDSRLGNPDFRRYFDSQMVYRLYPYLFDRNCRVRARRLSRKIEYSQLKMSMHLRMVFPHMYRFYQRLKRK